MTTARSLLVDPDAPGFYHCISRCVRRAWLCGIDSYSGTSYEHRRAWVEQRLLELAEIFAVGVYAYAVMSNHVHVVLRIDPTAAATWADEDVATRWVRLFPAAVDGEVDVLTCMSYVDLNPIRAGIAENLETSSHTSAQRRIAGLRENPDRAKQPPTSLKSAVEASFLSITTEDYLDLIDWTARLTRPDKRGSIDAIEPPILRKLGLSERQWHQQMIGTETKYWRAIGTAQALIEKAAAMGQGWLKGIGSAQRFLRPQPA